MNAELQEIYQQVVNHPYFVPAILCVVAIIVIVTILKKEKGTRGLLEGSAKLAIAKARENGLTVEEIYEKTVGHATKTIQNRIEGKGVYRRLLGKFTIQWINSKYIKGIITDFIRARVQELEK